MVPMDPEVSHRRGTAVRPYCAAHIWCWPTPVDTMARPCVNAATFSNTA
jgi:hypothetical protein